MRIPLPLDIKRLEQRNAIPIGELSNKRRAGIDDAKTTRHRGRRLPLEQRQDENTQQDRGQIINLQNLLMSRAFHNLEIRLHDARIQDHNVESGEVSLHSARKSLDGFVGRHLKRPHLDLGRRELDAQLGGCGLAFGGGSYRYDEVRELMSEKVHAAVVADAGAGTGDDGGLAGEIDVR